jgi:hypothetical protein
MSSYLNTYDFPFLLTSYYPRKRFTLPLDVPTLSTTSHGMHCHLPIITSSAIPNVAIAILACKWASCFYVGLVLELISDDATLPLYTVGNSIPWSSTDALYAGLTSHSMEFPESLFFVPGTNVDNTVRSISWQNSIAISPLQSKFWRDFVGSPPELHCQWTDIYIKYRHDTPKTTSPTNQLRLRLAGTLQGWHTEMQQLVPGWVFVNLRLLGFTLDHDKLSFFPWPQLLYLSFTHKLSRRRGGESNCEGFLIAVKQEGGRSIAACACIRIPGKHPSPDWPNLDDFSAARTWEGLSREFGDTERRVRLNFVPADTAVRGSACQLTIEAYGTVYSALAQKHK